MSDSWRDIFINRPLSREKIARGIGHIFAVATEQVEIFTREDEWWDKKQSDSQVICVVSELQGDFPLWIEILPLDERLFPKEQGDHTTAAKLCGFWQCDCLVSDDTPNPYQWMLINGVNDYRIVQVDPEILDAEIEADRGFVIKEYLERPTTKG